MLAEAKTRLVIVTRPLPSPVASPAHATAAVIAKPGMQQLFVRLRSALILWSTSPTTARVMVSALTAAQLRAAPTDAPVTAVERVAPPLAIAAMLTTAAVAPASRS